MRIVTDNYKTYNTNFQKRPMYSELKYVPNIRCACCDKKLINATQFGNALDSVSRPLKEILDKGFFDAWKKFDNAWKILTDLSEKYPKFPLGKIMENENDRRELKLAIRETIKPRPEKTYRENLEYIDTKVADFYTDITRRSRSSLYSASTVIKRLAPFKDCLTDTKKEIFEQFEIYARKYPRKTLTEIVNLEEVYKFHTAKDILQRAESREKLDYHFDNIMNMVKKENPEAVERLEELKQYSLDLLECERDPYARMHIIKNAYEDALQNYCCTKLTEKVFKELDQTPMTFITKDSFFAYAKKHNFNDSNIIYSLLIPSVASFEHIIPSSEYGSDKANNGIVLCRECNQWRSDIPYEEFIKYHPRMPYNTQKQVKMIGNYILKGNMDDSFRTWPIKVAKTLHFYSNGKINVNVDDYVKKALKQSNKNLEAKYYSIQNLKSERNEKIKEKENTKQKLEELEKNLSDIKNETEDLYDKYKEERILNDFLKQNLEKK